MLPYGESFEGGYKPFPLFPSILYNILDMTEETNSISDIVIEEKKHYKQKKIKGTQVCRIKGMRSDVKANLAKVSRYLLKNPDATNVEVQRET